MGCAQSQDSKYVDSTGNTGGNDKTASTFDNFATTIADGDPLFCIQQINNTLVCGGDGLIQFSPHSKQTNRYKGHRGDINRIVPTKDHLSFYSASRDCSIRKWSLDKYDEADFSFQGHELTVTAIALSTNEDQLFSGSRDCTVRLWDVETQTEICQNETTRNVVTDCKRIHDGDVYVQGSEDLRIRCWDSRDSLDCPCQIFDDFVYFPLSVDVSPDDNYVLASCKGFDGTGCEVKLFDRRNGSLVNEFKSHEQDVVFCSFIDDNRFVSVSKDGSICTWDSNNCTTPLASFQEINFGFPTSATVFKTEGGHNALTVVTFDGKLMSFEIDASNSDINTKSIQSMF